MITGDHPVTALAISRDLGLASEPSQVVTGSELAKMSPTEMEEAVKTARVFARVAPHQKLELVNAARRVGHFVAVTGDGVNDAPALRAANIGYAKVTVKIQTHRVRAVTYSDVELARRIDEVALWKPVEESAIDGFPKRWVH